VTHPGTAIDLAQIVIKYACEHLLTDLFERHSIAAEKQPIAETATATSVKRKAQYGEFSNISVDPLRFRSIYSRCCKITQFAAVTFSFAANPVCANFVYDDQRNAAGPVVSSL
jgi:hypothetical protein